MAEFARVNPVLGTNTATGFGSGRDHDELYSTLQLKVFVVDAYESLATQTGFNEAIEALTRELGTTAALFESNGTAGKFVVIGDGHALDAAVLQSRIRQLGTVNGFNFAVADVTEATSLFGISNA